MSYQPVTYTLGALQTGVRGTNQTLNEMARLVRRDSKDPRIVALARSIVADVKAHDELAELKELFRYVRNSVRYVQDPVDVEWVQDSERTIDFGAGDCDDLSTLFATLSASIGYVPVFVVGSYATDPSVQYDHVWVAVRANEKWTSADASEDKPLGWRSNDFAKLAYFPIFEGTPVPSQLGNLGQDEGYYDDSYYDDSYYDDSGSYYDDIDWDQVFFGDYNTDTGGGGTFDPNFDESDADYFAGTYVSDEDSALFDYLKQNYGYQGTSIDEMSLADIGIYMNPNGSYMQLNADGTLEFHNRDGSPVYLTDPNGQPLNGAGQSPSVLKQIANQAAKVLGGGGSGGSSGGGGGIPLGGGGSKAGAQQQPSATDSLSKTISSIANTIKSVLSGTPLQQYTGTANRINPLTGKPYTISSNGLYTSPQGAGIQLNTTTIIIGALLLMVFMKK